MNMEKLFDFPEGTLSVKKTTYNKKTCLKIALDSFAVHIGYDYESACDRAFTQFDERNAAAVYTGMLNLRQDL